MMNVLYNSETYAVFAYPEEQWLELVDKTEHRLLFLRGPSAMRFSVALQALPEEQRDEAGIDAFLEGYCSDADPIVFH